MAVEPISIRKMEKQCKDVYEVVMIVSQRARQIMHDRVAQEIFNIDEEYDFGALDMTPESEEEVYEEIEKSTTVALNDFMEGKLAWRHTENQENE